MSKAAALRPGIASGTYPEREDVRESWLDRAASTAFGALRQRLLPNSLDRGFLRQVEKAARGLDALAPHEITDAIAELRRELRRHGLRPDIVARSFAIIREMSHRKLGMRHFDVQLLGG